MYVYIYMYVCVCVCVCVHALKINRTIFVFCCCFFLLFSHLCLFLTSFASMFVGDTVNKSSYHEIL